MMLKPVLDGMGRTMWVAQTDNGDFHAVGQDPLTAVTRLAQLLEKYLLSS